MKSAEKAECGNMKRGNASGRSPNSDPGPGAAGEAPGIGRQSRLWAGINAVMAVFFALAAYVQINDPDPHIWIPIYVIPSLLCCAIVWSRSAVDHMLWRIMAAVYLSLCLVGIAILTVQVGQQMKEGLFNPISLEEGRELFGLLIAFLWTLMCWFSGYMTATCSTGRLSAMTWLVVLVGMMPLAIWGTCYQSHFKHCNDML